MHLSRVSSQESIIVRNLEQSSSTVTRDDDLDRDQTPGSAGIGLSERQESNMETLRKKCSCHYDERHRSQIRSRYRADIILRPLISQDSNADAAVAASSSSSPTPECRPVYGGDNARRVVDRLAETDTDLNAKVEECLKRRPVSTRNSDSKAPCRRYHPDTRRLRSPWPWSRFRLFAMALLVIFSLSALVDVGRCQSVLADAQKGTLSTLSNATSIPSGVNSSKILPIERRDQQNRKGRHNRIHPPPRHPSSTAFDDFNGAAGNWATGDGPEADEDKQHRLTKAAFRQLSRMAFKALINEDFQDRPLRAPDDDGNGGADESELTPDGKRQLRRQQRKLQRQRQRQLRRQQGRRLDEDERGDGGDFLPPASDYNQRELIDQQDESSSADQNDHRLPGRRRAIAIATKDSIKPDSCRTMPLKQRVRMTGCSTKIVVNHFCYGQCNSFYIPKLSKKRLRAAFESCSVCKPKTYVPVTITLHCPSRNPPYLKRKIMKVKECSCMPANVSENDIVQ